MSLQQASYTPSFGGLGLTNTEAGALFSASLVGYAVAALFIVPLTDRLGTKHILLGAAVVSVVTHLLFPLVANDLPSGLLLSPNPPMDRDGRREDSGRG